MDLGIRDRSFLVTGGSSGIGLATVTLLLDEGARVTTCGRSPERLESALSALSAQHPGRLRWESANVRDAADMERLVAGAVDAFGGLDGLVNNAGASRVSTFATTTDEDWSDEFSVKFDGLLAPLRAALPHLRESDAGAVVNMNAVLARQPEKHLVATSAMRAGLLNLSKSLAGELAADGIRVNSVCVGLIDTGQWKRRYDAEAPAEDFTTWARDIARDRRAALERFGTAEEVAATIVFLLSPRSSYTTGATIDVAGGVSRYV